MRFRLATDADKDLPYYSHSIAEAITTCPKWGLIRYKQRKYFKTNFRQMALEAGSQMHEVFAAFRLWQLARLQQLPEHARHRGIQLFGETRYDACFRERSDPRDELLAFCFEILNSGEFYDDPNDNVRTMSNLEETTIRYCDTQLNVASRNPVWVRDPSDPTALVGVELAFDMVIDDDIRYIGTIDGLAQRGDRVRLEENKTASRLDDAFRQSFDVKFQPTGYTVGARLLTGVDDIDETKIIGVKLKQTRSHEDMLSFEVFRDDEAIGNWYRFIRFVHTLSTQYQDDPLNAPQFTHSCNRYFRPCGFIDLCAAGYSDQLDMYNAMEETPLSPSEEAILSRKDK